MTLTIPELFLLGFLALIIIGELIFLVKMIIFAYKGAPYAATDDLTLKEMVKVVKELKGKKVVDIGSGDGKIIYALAEAGIEAHGVELNLLLTLWTRWQIHRRGLQKKVFIHRRDMWKEDLSQYDVIISYQITYIMKRLEKKLKAEIKPGAYVISNHFTFPTWKPKQKKGRLTIYTK